MSSWEEIRLCLSPQAPNQDNGGTKRNEGGSSVLPKHASFQMWPKPQEILRMIPKTKPDFEIPISSHAFEDYRILLFNFVF